MKILFFNGAFQGCKFLIEIFKEAYQVLGVFTVTSDKHYVFQKSWLQNELDIKPKIVRIWSMVQ